MATLATRLAAVALVVALTGAGLPAPVKAMETLAREAIVVEMATGAVLFEKAADASMPPASMSKMMTVYTVFERLKDGRLSLDDTFTVSRRAWRLGGARSGSSTMFLEPDSRVKVEDLLRGIIVQSGNDACIVIAEGLAVSEEAFAREMTARARELGLTGSIFTNATGWPDPDHRTTARDMALLAEHTIRDFPQFFPLYSERSFTYNGILQYNRNPLLRLGVGVDGLKTGHTEESGFGLTATAKRDNRRLIVVVNGLPSKKARGREAGRLLDWGFSEFNNYQLFKAGEEVLKADVWLGQDARVPVVIDRDVVVTLERKARKNLKVLVRHKGPVRAPVKAGDVIASVEISATDFKTLTIPLRAGGDVQRLGLFGRLLAAFRYIILGNSG